MSISTNEYNHVTQNNFVGNKSTITWYKADKGHISNYEKYMLCYMLCNDIDLYKLVFY